MTVANLPAHLVDADVFEEMREALEDDFADLIQSFLEDTRELLSALSSGLRSNKIESVQLAAHSLKSTSASLGFISLSESACALEALAREGSLIGAEKYVQLLDAEFPELEKVLRSAV